jgi:hypothetical protein
MLKFNFEALNTDGGRTKGVMEAESSQHALEKIKERGLSPTSIEPISADGIATSSVSASSQDASEVKHIPSFGWKIRLRKLLIFHIPFLFVAGLGFYLLFTGKPGWLIFVLMVAGLIIFGLAGLRAERRMLGSFVCPHCQTPIEDWDANATQRILYDCHQCRIKWDIGYKLRKGGSE